MSNVAFTPVVGDVRGKVGNTVFAAARSGPTIRLRVKPVNPRSAAQTAVRAALTAAARSFEGMTAANVALWETYAAGITKVNPVSGASYHPSAIAAFMALATKFLQITPGGTIPQTPPATPFDGDTITVAVTETANTLVYTASNSNEADAQTECLYQLLAGPNRKPSPDAYKSGGFLDAVSPGSLVKNITVPVGWYSCAYRFVKDTTGEQSGLVVQDTLLHVEAS